MSAEKLTSNEQVYLAQFIAEHHDIPLEKAIKFIDSSYNNSQLEDHSFIDYPRRVQFSDEVHQLSEEFISRCEYLMELAEGYCIHNPKYVSDNFVSYMSLTEEREQELKFSRTKKHEPKWYTDDQIPQICSELETSLIEIQDRIDDEQIPDPHKSALHLNIALMLYGVERFNTEPYICVTFTNAYYSFRSAIGNTGLVSGDMPESHLDSLGGRIKKTFETDTVTIEENKEEFIDTVIDALELHYGSTVRSLVHSVERSINLAS